MASRVLLHHNRHTCLLSNAKVIEYEIATFVEISRHLSGRNQTVKVHNLASLTPNSSASSSSLGGSFSHRRRRSTLTNALQTLLLDRAKSADSNKHPTQSSPQSLLPLPGTPNLPMSLSRSPSPSPGGGWASPGLSSPAFVNVSGRPSPHKTWESAQAKTDGVSGHPSFSTQNNGFFKRHYRKLSNSLPRFSIGSEKSYAEKEKLGRGRWTPRDGSKLGRLRAAAGRVSRKMRLRLLVVLAFIMMFILFYSTRMLHNLAS